MTLAYLFSLKERYEKERKKEMGEKKKRDGRMLVFHLRGNKWQGENKRR